MDVLKCKQELVKLLKESSLTSAKFSGRLVINLNQGGVTDVERIEIVALGDDLSGTK